MIDEYPSPPYLANITFYNQRFLTSSSLGPRGQLASKRPSFATQKIKHPSKKSSASKL
jgi:hypothetical protein